MTGDPVPVDVALSAGLETRLGQDAGGLPALLVTSGGVVVARYAGGGDHDEVLDALDTLIDGLCQLRTAMEERRRREWAAQIPEHLRRDAVRLPRIHPPPGNSGPN